MKVLFAVPRYHTNHDGWVAGLLAAGHEVGFLVRSLGPNEKHRPGASVSVLGRDGPARGAADRPRGFLPAFRHAYGFLRRTRPDVVVARNADSTSYAIFLACRLLGIRYLLYVQSRTGFETLSPGRRLRLRLGLWPRHTINSACPVPTATAPPGKTFDFTPFAVDLTEPEKTDYPDAPPLRLLAIGKFDQARKNLAPLLRALAPRLRDGTLLLTIAGQRQPQPSAPYIALTNEIAGQDLVGAVTLLANLDYDHARRLYAAHDLYLLASSHEPAAISPAEAMAAGIPAICGSDNGTNYFVEPGETGFVFADGDFAGLAQLVGRFLDHPEDIERMGRAARRLIAETYAPEAFARRFEAIVARRFGPVRPTAPAGRPARSAPDDRR